MAKHKNEQEEEVILDVQEAYSKTEKFFNENGKNLTIGFVAVALLIGVFFSYKNFVVAPNEQEAKEQIWKAEQWFEQDSLDLAINGDGNNYGFLYIADEYSSTKAGNLANYYLGLIYMKKSDYALALEYLKEFKSDDVMLSAVSQGAIGDCYSELKDTEAALSYYKKALAASANEFTTPVYLMKAATHAEALGDYNAALGFYKKIEANYKNTSEGRNIEKYIARAEQMTK